MPNPNQDVPSANQDPSPDQDVTSDAGSGTRAEAGTGRRGHPEMKVAAAALAAAASPPLGIVVAAGAALSSPDVRNVLRRATVQAVAAAMEVGDQINAVVARRAGTSEPPAGPSEPATPAASSSGA